MQPEELQRSQEGVIARRQAVALGLTDNDIKRLIRQRQWARVHAGVYVNHTGSLSEAQSDWAAVLSQPVAALAGESALRHFGITTGSDHGLGHPVRPVSIVVPHSTTPARLRGVSITRRRDFASVVHPARTPPIVRVEDAVLEVAAASSEARSVAILSDACRSRRTTAARLGQAASDRSRLRHRAFLMAVLSDVDQGTHSLLEWRYQRDIERLHGLPDSLRQSKAQTSNGVAYRDVLYRDYGLVVELDGQLGHDLAIDRWADLDRDLASAQSGLLTVRLSYAQVLANCRSAERIAYLLGLRGWNRAPRPCGPACNVARSGAITAIERR